MKTNRIVLASLLSLSVLAMTACSAPPRNASNKVAPFGLGKTADGETGATSPIALVDGSVPVAPGETPVVRVFTNEELVQATEQYKEESRILAQSIQVLSISKESLETLSAKLNISQTIKDADGNDSLIFTPYSLSFAKLNEDGTATLDVLNTTTNEKDASISAVAKLVNKDLIAVVLRKFNDSKILSVQINMMSSLAKYQLKGSNGETLSEELNNSVAKNGDLVIDKVRVFALADAEKKDFTSGKVILTRTFKSFIKGQDQVFHGEVASSDYQGKIASEEGVNVSLVGLGDVSLQAQENIQEKQNGGQSVGKHLISIQMKASDGSITPMAFEMISAESEVAPDQKPADQTPAGQGIETKIEEAVSNAVAQVEQIPAEEATVAEPAKVSTPAASSTVADFSTVTSGSSVAKTRTPPSADPQPTPEAEEDIGFFKILVRDFDWNPFN